jgi:hypothetical protein
MLPDTIYISRNGQMLGSFHRDAIKAGLANQTYFPDDLAWYEGAPGWAPLRTLEGFSTPPPAPAPSTPPATPPTPPPIAPPVPPAIPAAASPPPIPARSPSPAPAPGVPPAIVGTAPKKRGCAGLFIFLALLFGLLLVAGGGLVAYKFGLWQSLSLHLRAARGDTAAMVRLGYRSMSKQDYSEAVRWFRKASDAGNASAEFALGELLTWKRRDLPPPQYKEAMRLFLKACDQGNGEACEYAAIIYDDGWFEFPKDEKEARRLFAKADALGSRTFRRPSVPASEPPTNNSSASTRQPSGLEGNYVDEADGGTLTITADHWKTKVVDIESDDLYTAKKTGGNSYEIVISFTNPVLKGQTMKATARKEGNFLYVTLEGSTEVKWKKK